MNRPKSFVPGGNNPAEGAAPKQQPAGDELVFDIHAMSRQLGTVINVARTVTLKEPIGLDMISVPAGGTIDLDVAFDMVTGGVYVSAAAKAQTVGECSRCLGKLNGTTEVRIDELFVDPSSSIAKESEDDDEDEIKLIEDDYIDLSQSLIDAIVLALPWSPTCDTVMGTDCVNTETPSPDGVAGEEAPRGDARWAALGDLFANAGDADDTMSAE